jgi:hypothetical protein
LGTSLSGLTSSLVNSQAGAPHLRVSSWMKKVFPSGRGFISKESQHTSALKGWSLNKKSQPGSVG